MTPDKYLVAGQEDINMAIDPSIALGVKQPEMPNWMEYAKLGLAQDTARQQIAASQTAQRKVEAEIPGTVAGSVSAQQKAQSDKQDQDARNAAIELASSGKYSKKNTDDVTEIDYPRLYGDLSVRFPQQALGMAKAKGESDYQTALARGQEAVTDQQKTKAASDMRAFFDNQIQVAANFLDKSGLPDADKAAKMKQITEGMAVHYPEAAKHSAYIEWSAAKPESIDPVTGQPIPPQPSKPVVSKVISGSDVKKIASGIMDPLTTAKLAIAQKELETATLQASLGYQAGKAGIPDAGTSAELKAKAAALQASVDIYNKGAGADVKGFGAGAPGSITQGVWNQLVAKGGGYADLDTALQHYNAKNGTNYTVYGMGVGNAKRLLETEAKVRGQEAKALQQGGTPRVPAGAPEVRGVQSTPAPGTPEPAGPAAAIQPPGTAAPGATVRIRNVKTGATGTIPAARLGEYLKSKEWMQVQ